MLDVSAYVGMPFSVRGRGPLTADCWGLVRIVYADRLGIELPSNCGYTDTLTDQTADLIAADRSGWIAVAEPEPWDVVLFNVDGRPNHIGLVIATGWMLHTTRRTDACIERYTRPAWRSRIEGFYRCPLR